MFDYPLILTQRRARCLLRGCDHGAVISVELDVQDLGFMLHVWLAKVITLRTTYVK